jgi:hypothetical protein
MIFNVFNISHFITLHFNITKFPFALKSNGIPPGNIPFFFFKELSTRSVSYRILVALKKWFLRNVSVHVCPYTFP